MTLPRDNKARKGIPMYTGGLLYFPDALAGVAKQSVIGNDQHQNGEQLTHDRTKSGDDGDAILRHLSDLGAAIAHFERALLRNPDMTVPCRELYTRDILKEADAIAWRSLSLSQKLHERYGLEPLAPAARSTL